jgi:hypothetical protein
MLPFSEFNCGFLSNHHLFMVSSRSKILSSRRGARPLSPYRSSDRWEGQRQRSSWAPLAAAWCMWLRHVKTQHLNKGVYVYVYIKKKGKSCLVYAPKNDRIIVAYLPLISISVSISISIYLYLSVTHTYKKYIYTYICTYCSHQESKRIYGISIHIW